MFLVGFILQGKDKVDNCHEPGGRNEGSNT